MASFKPVAISNAGFAFCRFTIASLLWLAVIFQNTMPIWAVLVLMLLSAILRVGRAPLILLWQYTVERFAPSRKVIVDENGLLFSHGVAVFFSALCLITIALTPLAGWVMTAAFALLQSVAACGFCSALKLYTCMTNGTCCRVGLFARKMRDNARSS